MLVYTDLKGNIEYFIQDNGGHLDVGRIKHLMESRTTIGFNSRMYDLPIINYALRGVSNDLLKQMSDRLIQENTYDVLCSHNLWPANNHDHIDLINVAFGKSSLKMYGARINTTNLQDLPYEPNSVLTEDKKDIIKKYCFNDVRITKDLYLHLKNSIEIRNIINNEYGVDVRSKSDAQIADVLVNKTLQANIRQIKQYSFHYKAPDYISFESDVLKELFNKFKNVRFEFEKGEKLDNQHLVDTCTLFEKKYTTGIGGLHSTEKARTIVAEDNQYIIDVDVVSYYPTIILNNQYCPVNYDKKEFISFYKRIYNDRISAKLAKNVTKSDIYKIILNGLFGKLGDKYSKLYSPELLINTTITGQLTLFMLIEQLEVAGFPIISANTDGVTAIVSKNNYYNFKEVIKKWENLTDLKTDEVKYKSLHNQSVNSYIAVKEDGTLKCKGVFANNDLSRNPFVKICKDAVFAYILKNKPIEHTIKNSKNDPCNFIIVRKVKDGAYWKNKYLGKVVRWYWSTKGEEIINNKGHKVANTDGAQPLMNLNEPLVDIDIDKYIRKSYKLLESIGINL